MYKGWTVQRTTFAELRKNIKIYFDVVKAVQTVRIYHKGKPLADIVPVVRKNTSWKRALPRITVKGITLAEEVLVDRSNTD
jgi:antitoxin (DNA-binding transcriptional repressor) of toxin-antitoxin stability system